MKNIFRKLAVAVKFILAVTVLAAVAVSADSSEPPSALADDIASAMLDFDEEVNISKYNIPTQNIELLKKAIVASSESHPEIVWASNSFSYEKELGKITLLKLNYTMTAEQSKKLLASADEEYEKITKGILPDMTDAEKVLVVNDYMCMNYEYDTTYSASYTHDMYGVMINKTGVCDSYSKAFLYVMNRLGIECRRMISDEMNHAWNCVKIDGKWYHVDVTWNDPVYDTIGNASHNYLLVSDYNINENYSAGGRNEPHYGWNDIGITCDSDIFENAAWRNSSRGIVFDNENMYMFTENRQLQAVNRKSGIAKTIYTISESYPVQGSTGAYWMGCFANIIPINDKIYFNTPKKIYSINKDGTGLALFRDFSAESGYIYGMRNVENIVYYGLGTDPNVKISVSGSFMIGSVPTVYIEDSVGTVGKEFTVNVKVKNSDGISSIKCSINFDSAMLDYVGISLADTDVTVKNGNISFTSNTSVSSDGKLFTMRFRVKSGADEGLAKIGFNASGTKITASNGSTANIGTTSADIEITKTYFGDTLGDGIINSSDGVALAQSLAKWAITIDKAAADVNRDGEINAKDSVAIAQYLAKWDIILGKRAS